jgi:hypothetical protein
MVNQPALSEANQRLIKLLLDEGVRFLVIGGQAMRCHGAARETIGLDLWLSPTREDAERLGRSFAKVDAARGADDWAEQIHRPNVRIPFPSDTRKHADILTSIEGADFEGAYVRREVAEFGGLSVGVVSLPDLIHTKRSSLASANVAEAKARDQLDIEVLEKMR